MIQIKRIYAPAQKDDGYRILVDRLWPRGLSKEKARIDLWLKEIGPSNELRKWFGHNDNKWNEFKEKYRDELQEETKQELLRKMLRLEKEKGTITLLFSAKNTDHNNAVALNELLKKDRQKEKQTSTAAD
jgi:uncharacterized protein YeaO (DUF488 family)